MSARRHPRLTDRLRAHEVGFGAVLATTILTLTTVAVLSTNGLPLASTYRVHATLPTNAPAIRAGTEVRIAGRRAGLITDVHLTAGARQRVTLTVAHGPVGADATIDLRLRSPAGGRYVALLRGHPQDSPLPNGGQIRATNVHTSEDLVAVVNGFTRASLRNASSSLRLTGAALTHVGAPVNAGIRHLDRTLALTATLASAIAKSNRLPQLVHDTGLVAGALTDDRTDDLGRLTTAAATFFAALAQRSRHLATALDQFAPAQRTALNVLPEIDRVLIKGNRASRQLAPAIAALRQALPPLGRVLNDGDTARRELAAISAPAIPALRRLSPVLRATGPAAVLLTRMFPPLGRLAGFMAQYDREFEAGSIGYWIAANYKPRVGRGPGYPIAPAMLIMTCASGTNPSPKPGDFFRDRLARPCR